LRNLDVGMTGPSQETADRVDAKIAAQTKEKTAMSIRNPSSSASRGRVHRGRKRRSSLGGRESEIRHGASGLRSVSLPVRRRIENFGVAAHWIAVSSWRRDSPSLKCSSRRSRKIPQRGAVGLALGAGSIWRSTAHWRERPCGKSLYGLELSGLSNAWPSGVMTASLLRAEEAKQDGSVDGGSSASTSRPVIGEAMQINAAGPVARISRSPPCRRARMWQHDGLRPLGVPGHRCGAEPVSSL